MLVLEFPFNSMRYYSITCHVICVREGEHKRIDYQSVKTNN